jgi:hypothetical protein
MSERYAFQQCENKEYGIVHLSCKVPKMPSWISDRETTPEAKELKQKLEALEGVEEAYSSGQSVRIKRAGVFTFAELLPSVLSVLKKELAIDDWTQVEPYA